MRTTIDIPNSLMTKAKIKAAKEGVTLKDLFIKSLEAELQESSEEVSHAKLLQDARASIISEDITPEDAPLEFFEPESEFFFYVNEPKSNKSDK